MSERPRGPLPGWEPNSAKQKAVLADVVAMYRQHEADGTLPRGGRGIFYDLRPNGFDNGMTYIKPADHPTGKYGPTEVSPEYLQEELLPLARRAGIIPEEWVADKRAPEPIGPGFYSNDTADDYADMLVGWVRDALEGADESITWDPQRNQGVYVEVACEAADLAPRLARVAEPYGVTVYAGAGFQGIKGKRAFAERAVRRDVPTVVLQVTDRDKAGEDLARAQAEDAEAWFRHFQSRLAGNGAGLRFERIALTVEQAEEFHLLDKKGKAEADAIPVREMDAILTSALDELIDPSVRAETLRAQQAERGRLPAAVRAALDAMWGDLPDGLDDDERDDT